MKIVTLEEARRQGLKRYYTGRPCKHGHLAERRTNHGQCCECSKKNTNKHYHKKQQSDSRFRYSKHLKHTFGISLEEFDQLVLKAGNCCQICTTPFTETPNVDHCHSTGVIRGVLCGNCNRGLGLLKDDIDVLEKAIGYLKG